MEEKLHFQKRTVIAKQKNLKRIEQKIDNRLRMLEDAKNSVFDTVQLIRKAKFRMVLINSQIKIHSFLDMEKPIRELDRNQTEAVVFLGKVGIGIAPKNLEKGLFDRYDCSFLILDKEDSFEGETTEIPESLCVSVRFHGSHTEAPEQYKKLFSYITKHNLKIIGFSREITMIDYGLTDDLSKFVTEISIPVKYI